MIAFLLASCGKDRIFVDGEGGIEPKGGPRFVFDDTKLPTLSVSVTETEWNRLLELYDQDNHNHSYVSCYAVTLERDDVTLRTDNAGLRLRGQTSRRRPEGKGGQRHSATNPKWHHVHFGLHFRKFNEDGGLANVRRINLKYAKEDPSYIREHFCFEMLREYGVWTAPMTSWCCLSLQVGNTPPANFGVYLMMESIDKQYVKQRPQFGPEWGYLWKCGWGANLRDTDDWRFHLDDDSSDTYAYELKSDETADFGPAKAQLKDFIKQLNTLKGADLYNWIQAHCDVDLLLRMYAANVALGHWDDYWNDMNNFYLYFNSRDLHNYKVYMLPYDYDNTLGTSHYCGVQHDSGRHDPYNWGLDECVLVEVCRLPQYLYGLSSRTLRREQPLHRPPPERIPHPPVAICPATLRGQRHRRGHGDQRPPRLLGQPPRIPPPRRQLQQLVPRQSRIHPVLSAVVTTFFHIFTEI